MSVKLFSFSIPKRLRSLWIEKLTMKFLLMLFFSFLIFPIFAQEENNMNMNNSGNSTFDISHSEIQKGINKLLEEHESTLTLIEQSDNISTLILGIIAIVLTAGLGGIALQQNKKSNKVITETQILSSAIKKDTEESTKIRNEVKEYVSFILKKKIHFVKRSLQRCQVLYQKYKEEKDPNKKKNYLDNVFENFGKCHVYFRIDHDLIKLIEIFGKTIAERYWSLLTDFQMNEAHFWVEDMGDWDSFMDHVETCLKNTESFEKLIEPFASAYVKGKSDPSQGST